MVKHTSKRFLWGSFILYLLSLITYSVFSYSLTAPNLVLSSNSTFWKFQSLMWETFFNNRDLLTKSYFTIMTVTVVSYLLFVSQLIKHKVNKSKLIVVLFISLIAPLLLSNNALSYDVFNYIFNAKMVSVYQVDPHVAVALDFPDDPWTKFMHNTHTAAPYGKAWTYLSIVPFTLGMGKFITTWLSFRVFSILPLLLLLFIFIKLKKKVNNIWLLMLAFNPLVLIEVISNIHNDFWMVTPGIISLLLIDGIKKSKGKGNKSKNNTVIALTIVASIVLLGLSIWVKLATLLLIPVWLLILINEKLIGIPRFYLIANNWALLASIAMFAPLLTSRSQMFHPWYLVWSISFIPLFNKNKLSKIWATALLVLSISSMYRYLPFLLNNNYDGNVLLWQKLISFTPFVIALILGLKRTYLCKK